MPSNKILVVDNADSTRHFTRYILTTAGFRVTAVTNPRDALEYATDSYFDAIITDVLTPELEGVELVKKLRGLEEYEHIPILVITLVNDEESIQQGMDAGATEWLTKPVSHKHLVDKLKLLCPARDDENPLFQ